MADKYAVFILSHGRADKVYTYETLRKQGYTGKIFLVIDDEDEQSELYYELFSDVIQFSKEKYRGTFDIGDAGGNDKVVVYARNAMNDIAKESGYEKYIVLDDGYRAFSFRWADGGSLRATSCKNLDALFKATFEFLDKSGALSICYAQAGDFIGGAEGGNFKKGILRKAMNVWFCTTERPFKFYGRINEDTTTNALLTQRGHLFFTITAVAINQTMTQESAGGLTEIYRQMGTFYKSFYSVMMCPSCVSVRDMGRSNRRIHHQVHWNACAPKILSERYKK